MGTLCLFSLLYAPTHVVNAICVSHFDSNTIIGVLAADTLVSCLPQEVCSS